MNWSNATSFTTADLAANHVRFVHDGGEVAPTFSIQANDGSAANNLSNILSGNVSFTNVNDAPAITSASLTISEGATVLLTPANIGVTDPDSSSFTFSATSVTHGSFQTSTDGVNWVNATSFTTADLTSNHVRFVHDGSELAPTFSIQANDGSAVNNLSNIFAGNITFTNVNDAPVITSALLTVSEGGTVLLTPASIGVTDPDSSTFAFSVTNVTHGSFQTSTDGVNWVNATSFTTADLAANHVRFAHDGGEAAPTFSIQANDGSAVNNLSNILGGSVSFTNVNDAPAITSASLTLLEGGTVALTPSSIGVTDPDNSSFTFSVTNVTHGSFQTSTDGVNWSNATSFTTADLAANHVRFVHDGGEVAPTFSIQANDGSAVNNLSNIFAGNVSFTNVNDAPVITAASLTLAEGATVLLTPASVGVADPDNSSFTFSVTNVTHGSFQTSTDGVNWTNVTSFTTADLAGNHVRFVHDGGEAAPTFSIQANDGSAVNNLSSIFVGNVTFTNVNDAPVITTASLTIATGATVLFTPADVGVTDPDSASFTFSVTNVTHGTFQTTTDGTNWSSASSFTTTDLAANHVRFVHDGGVAAPTFSIQANDGAAVNNLSNIFTGNVAFNTINHAPVVTSASLTIAEGATVLLTPANVGVSDPDNSSFTFGVTNVTHGSFQTSTDGVNWANATSFTTADLAASHVRFVHDGGEAAPTFSIQANDGSAVNNLSNIFASSVSFTNVNDAPVASP